MTGPRFPPPWSIGEHNDACFTVRDNNGQQLADELFRGRTGPPLGGQAFDARRGAAHRSQYCPAAIASARAVKRSGA
jgi:hypothetical protein